MKEAYTMARAVSAAGRRSSSSRVAAALVIALVTLGIWLLFAPGLLSADSVEQYRQALVGQYNDWQPPLLSLLLHAVLRLGGSLALLTLAQCALLLFGIAALARAWDRALVPRLCRVRQGWVSVAVVLLLLLPVTPLAFYAMTFWKDVWAALLLTWMAVLLLALLAAPSAGRAAVLVTLGVCLGLVRHNAIVALPVLGVGLAVAWWSRGRAKAVAIAVAPTVLCLLAGPLLERAFDVEELHPSSQIMVLDLVGLCAESEHVCADLPWTRAHILDFAALARFQPGDFGFIFWDQPAHVSPTIRSDFGRLRAEYWHAVRTYPAALARLKLREFTPMLGRHETYYFFHPSVVPNRYHLALDPRYEPLRARLVSWSSRVGKSPLRWIAGVHLVWLAVTVGWLVTTAVAFARRRDPRFLHLAITIALPLAYATSYLPATPVHDFRFLYPASLFAQCVTLAAGLGALAQKPTGRAPSRSTLAA